MDGSRILSATVELLPAMLAIQKQNSSFLLHLSLRICTSIKISIISHLGSLKKELGKVIRWEFIILICQFRSVNLTSCQPLKCNPVHVPLQFWISPCLTWNPSAFHQFFMPQAFSASVVYTCEVRVRIIGIQKIKHGKESRNDQEKTFKWWGYPTRQTTTWHVSSCFKCGLPLQLI